MRVLHFLFAAALFYLYQQLGHALIMPSEEEIENLLRKHNKPAVKSITTEHGYILDCVDTYKQPSLDHPLLKNHKIQLKVNDFPFGRNSTGKTKRAVWKKSGCPKGTVPIRRKTREDIIKGIPYGSLGYYPEEIITITDDPMEETARATSLARRPIIYAGVSAKINLWDIGENHPDEYSASYIGLFHVQEKRWLRAGTMVNEEIYPSEEPALFVSWRNGEEGCLNTECDGFVQVDSDYYPGVTFGPLSVKNGRQVDIEVTIYRNNQQNRWFLFVNDVLVGYWPGRLMGANFRRNCMAEWTGLIRNARVEGYHTDILMGSGQFAVRDGYKFSAYFGRMLVINSTNQAVLAPDTLHLQAMYPHCYNIVEGDLRDEDHPGLRVYFGGHGGRGCEFDDPPLLV